MKKQKTQNMSDFIGIGYIVPTSNYMERFFRLTVLDENFSDDLRNFWRWIDYLGMKALLPKLLLQQSRDTW